MIELYIRKLYKELQRKVKGKISIKFSSTSGNLIIRIKSNNIEYVEEIADIETAISNGYSIHLCAILCCQSYKQFLLTKFFN